jgi:hypothetical protein
MVSKKPLGWIALLVGVHFLLLDLAMVITQPYLLTVPLSLALICLYGVAGSALLYLGWKALRGRS